MPFDLGHHAADFVPALGPVAEAGVIAPHMDRRTANGSREQVTDAAAYAPTVGLTPPLDAPTMNHDLSVLSLAPASLWGLSCALKAKDKNQMTNK